MSVRDSFLAGFTASPAVDLDDIFLNDEDYAARYVERVVFGNHPVPITMSC